MARADIDELPRRKRHYDNSKSLPQRQKPAQRTNWVAISAAAGIGAALLASLVFLVIFFASSPSPASSNNVNASSGSSEDSLFKKSATNDFSSKDLKIECGAINDDYNAPPQNKPRLSLTIKGKIASPRDYFIVAIEHPASGVRQAIGSLHKIDLENFRESCLFDDYLLSANGITVVVIENKDTREVIARKTILVSGTEWRKSIRF